MKFLNNHQTQQNSPVNKTNINQNTSFNTNKKTRNNHAGNKFLKTICCGMGAMIIAFLGILSTACTPNIVNNNSNSVTLQTQNSGLITPCADDPVIHTTEYGLEIKYGNATIQTSLDTSTLAGFPYFTTSAGSVTYTWVIIGSNITTPDDSQAGSAIANDANANWQKIHEYKDWTDSLYHNADIPSNCVLVLLNSIISPVYYCYDNLSINGVQNSGYSETDIRYTLEGYYDAGSYGISEIKQSIVPVNLITQGARMSRDGSWERFTDLTENVHIFILSGNSESSFYLLDFLSIYQSSLSSNYWLRGLKSSDTMNNGQPPHVNVHYKSSISYVMTTYRNTYCSARPAFCMSL